MASVLRHSPEFISSDENAASESDAKATFFILLACRLVFFGWILVTGTFVLCGTFLLLHKGVFGLGTTWDGLNLSPFFWVGLVPFDIWLEG